MGPILCQPQCLWWLPLNGQKFIESGENLIKAWKGSTDTRREWGDF